MKWDLGQNVPVLAGNLEDRRQWGRVGVKDMAHLVKVKKKSLENALAHITTGFLYNCQKKNFLEICIFRNVTIRKKNRSQKSE